MKNIFLKDTNREEIEAVIRPLNERDINIILNLQEEVINNIDDKELFALTSKEEFIECINGLGTVLGVLSKNDNELIAVGVYIKFGTREENYGYDLELEEDMLFKVGQIEATMVSEKFRGNKLQTLICNELELLAREDNINILTATVSPKNEYSLNNFLKLGYEIKKEKLKYGGYKRYILSKNL